MTDEYHSLVNTLVAKTEEQAKEIGRLREVLAWAQRVYATFEAKHEGVEMDEWQTWRAAMFFAPDMVKRIKEEA